MTRAICIALALAAFGAAGCGSREQTRPLEPPDFFGVVAPDVFATDSVPYRDRALRLQRSAGIGLVRQTFDWRHIEKASRRGYYEFDFHDRYMVRLARRGMRVLPVLFGAPSFRSSAPAEGAADGTYPPRSNAQFGRFAAALVRRYGPDGSFWRAHPDLPPLPIHAWQVWNEPSLPAYWPTGPDPVEYTRLLAATARAIKAEDPHADVVSAGLPQSRRGVPFERYLDGMYRAGAKEHFDVLAIHAFARDARGAVAAVETTRRLMAAQGDGAPIWITELGWASGGPPSDFTVGAAGQARRIGRALKELAQRRLELRLRGIVYFSWKDAEPFQDNPDFFGLHTGLLGLDGKPKPALAAYRRGVGTPPE